MIMKCGCSSFGITVNGVPGCGVHACTEPMDTAPDLTNRRMRCSYGGNEKPSNPKAAFFEYCPSEDFDRYYCGCYGWD